MSVSRSAFDVAAGLVGAFGVGSFGVGQATPGIRPGDGRTASRVRDVMPVGATRRGGVRRQVAALVALGQNRDREVRAVAFAQPAPDAIRRLDDRVVGQKEAVLRADLDADVAALTPLVSPADVDVVDDGRCAMSALFSSVWRSRGRSPDSVDGPRVMSTGD